ncbi:MAG: flippase-like domain-containing protein, partial [Actinobacteria bacterium]|nr:flippase-like domain-containing protein [Actinomycetota bacterium]
MTHRSTLFTRRAGIITLGLVVTAVLLWWVLRGVNLHQVWAAFLTADHRWLAVSVLAVIGTVATRALRWHMLLVAAVPRTSLRSTVLATMLGQGANNALPAHGGELARAVAIARLDRISGATALGSIGVERALDLVTVASMLVAAVLARPLSSGASTSPVRILLIALGAGDVVVALLALATRQAARLASVSSAVAVKVLGDRAGTRLGAGISAGLAG